MASDISSSSEPFPYRLLMCAIHVCLLASFAACSFSGQQAPLTGTVTDPENKPVVDAIVHLFRDQSEIAVTRSNAEGVFTFAALGPGNYTVRVEVFGFAPAARNL